MTLNQLGYFYQAAVLQHFNQAAEKMNISEPSLSRSISSLEDELGVTLFEKRGRKLFFGIPVIQKKTFVTRGV